MSALADIIPRAGTASSAATHYLDVISVSKLDQAPCAPNAINPSSISRTTAPATRASLSTIPNAQPAPSSALPATRQTYVQSVKKTTTCPMENAAKVASTHS